MKLAKRLSRQYIPMVGKSICIYRIHRGTFWPSRARRHTMFRVLAHSQGASRSRGRISARKPLSEAHLLFRKMWFPQSRQPTSFARHDGPHRRAPRPTAQGWTRLNFQLRLSGRPLSSNLRDSIHTWHEVVEVQMMTRARAWWACWVWGREPSCFYPAGGGPVAQPASPTDRLSQK